MTDIGLINTVAQLTAAFIGAPLSWFDQLQPASYRGVPFAVLGADGEFGRRNAVHEYPFRDTVWVEDLGRSARRIHVLGFLIGDDVITQAAQMIAAAEQPGQGQLVHPTLGSLNVSLAQPLRTIQKYDRGRYYEIEFSFIEAGQRLFPSTIIATGAAVLAAALGGDSAATIDFGTAAAIALQDGAEVAQIAATTVAIWSATTQRLGNDATNLQSMVALLPGNFGRYFGGRSTGGFITVTPDITAASATIDSLLAQGTAERQNISAASATVATAATGLSPTTTDAFAIAVQDLAAALLAATVDPADGVRLLADLADFTPAAPTPASQQGQAMNTMQGATGDLCRRAAVAALARASSTYQPSSYDDAAALRTLLCDLLDLEITVAGDQGEDQTYDAFRALRVSVVQDLTARGANLAHIVTFSLNQTLPALVLANRFYRDASRADELVVQADPVHPAFMPTSFQALAD